MVWLSAERRGSLIHILVDDEGGGLDPAMEGRLFEPFATTKPPGEGTGLGLYASYMLVQTMGGDLTIENREPCGVRARIKLPAGLAKATGVHQRAH
jgi:C4-dicarboxylate-specific signal transduction histidine kinase